MPRHTSFDPIYSISEFASMLHVDKDVILIFEKMEILIAKRNDKNRRRYSDDDITKAKFILYLTQYLKLDLINIKIILLFLEKANVNIVRYEKLAHDVVDEILFGKDDIPAICHEDITFSYEDFVAMNLKKIN